MDRNVLIAALEKQLQSDFKRWLPDIVQSLPDALLLLVNQQELAAQIKALWLLHEGELGRELIMGNQQRNRFTVLSTSNQPGTLARLLEQLPNEKPLTRADIFTTHDGRFVIDLFEFQDSETQARVAPLPEQAIQKYVADIKHRLHMDESSVAPFVHAIGSHNRQYSVEVLSEQCRLFHEVAGSDRVAVRSFDTANGSYLILAMGHSTTRSLLYRTALFLGRANVGIIASTCDDVTLDSDSVALLTLRLEHAIAEQLQGLLQRFTMCDPEIVEHLKHDPALEVLDLEDVEFLYAAARLVRYRVLRHSQARISLEEVLQVFSRYSEISAAVVKRCRCGAEATSSRILEQFDPHRDTSEPTEQQVMQALVNLPIAIEKSNQDVPHRHCLAFRIHPSFFETPEQPRPFAVFYVCGRGFDGFHVRFRDIARGGMRIVRSRSHDHYLMESQRVYHEAHELAWAQNLKNKDIPEGGAKAVVLARPNMAPDYVGRRFVDGLLDLVTSRPADDSTFGQEYLYLGPDENVSADLIDWIIDTARVRGYEFPNTIMSSKPKLGINHKEFGVTSEGLVVFLHQCIRRTKKFDGEAPFSVKLTGGPDGDVAGNAIRILIREFGDRVQFVGIADGTGCVTDPSGLSQDELLRLVQANLPISAYRTSALSAVGRLTGVQSVEEERLRNNMPFRVPSDVFLPCGGRPGSINRFNVDLFLGPDGPMSSIIVEGANLYVTPEARERLSEAGVWIIKDSSANKGGVICSSLEILAGMLFSDEELLAVKPSFVPEVIAHLKDRAAWEADGLFAEKRRQPLISLPQLSVLISQQILKVTAIIEEWLDNHPDRMNPMLDLLWTSHLPATLSRPNPRRAVSSLPGSYKKQFVSAALASQLVYREGCRNLELMDAEGVLALVSEHLATFATPI